MEEKKRQPSSSFWAGRDAGSCKKTDDAPLVREEERNESLQGSQPSISEKQMTADEEVSEEGVQDEGSSKSVLSLLGTSSSSSAFSIWMPYGYDSWHETKIRPDPLLRREKPTGSTQFVCNEVSLQRSLESSENSTTEGEVGDRRDKISSTTTVQHDPDREILKYLIQQRAGRVRSSCSASSAGHDTGIHMRTTGVPQGKNKELGIFRNREGQTSISENQENEDKKISKKGVQDKLPSKSVPGLPQNSSLTSFFSIWDFDPIASMHETGIHPDLVISPPSQQSFIYEPQMSTSKLPGSQIIKKHKEKSLSMTSTTASPDYMLDQLPLGAPRQTVKIKKRSSARGSRAGGNQDDTRKMKLHEKAGTSKLHYDDSDTAAVYEGVKVMEEMTGSLFLGSADQENHKDKHTHLNSPPLSDFYIHPVNRKGAHDGGPRVNDPGYTVPTCSWSISPNVIASPGPQYTPTVPLDSAVSTEGSRPQDAFELSSVQSGSQPVGDSDVLMEMDTPVTAANYSLTNTLSAHSHLLQSPECFRSRDSSCLRRSHSLPSLSQITSAKNKSSTRAESLPHMLLTNSFEEFTAEMTADENDETYMFQCSCPGLYQCSVTGLVFHMEGEGDVVYRIVPWNRRLLAQHHKKPAGPLFDINCPQQSVCQLHLPHCEIRSKGGCDFLSVAHVNNKGIEFIIPHKITKTHVIINITGFSAYGNVKDEDSPPDPVRALVLLFYRPPADPDLKSLLNVLLLPKNVVLQDVLRTRKKLVGDESYIETSPHCKLCPKQEYTLSTCPEDDSVLVQPKRAEFDSDNYDNYFPSFQVRFKKVFVDITLLLKDTNSSHSVWEREVCLSSPGVRRSCGPSVLNLPPSKRLLDVRSSFIDGISGPVLKSLLDKLLEKKVIADSERESADVMQNKSDKARFVIDTVRKKGEAASLEMIEFLCEADPFLCEHLGLI